MNVKPNKEHCYLKRSCLLCKRYPCFQGQSEMECDYAKYGCLKYDGKYQKERKISEINKSKIKSK